MKGARRLCFLARWTESNDYIARHIDSHGDQHMARLPKSAQCVLRNVFQSRSGLLKDVISGHADETAVC